MFRWITKMLCAHEWQKARDGRRLFVRCWKCSAQTKGILIGRPTKPIELPVVGLSIRESVTQKGEAA